MRVNADQPVAVVTGGNRGVGREVCRQLALLGFSVVLGSRDLRRGELAAKELDPEGIRIVACPLEVDNSVSVASMAEWVKNRFGRTDVLVNNEGGSISVMTGGSPAYSVSKAALNALTRLLAAELARDGILVNAVCPGWPASENHPDGRSITQAAASVIWAITIPNGGPTGTLTRDGQPYPW